jgi:hypothetical protein
MNVPTIYLVDDLVDTLNDDAKSGVSTCINGYWYAARPIGFQGLNLIDRIKIAWRVFTGKYDALLWKENDTQN